MVFDKGTPYHDYFSDQIRFLERLATNLREPWKSKGLRVEPLTIDLFEPDTVRGPDGEDVSDWVDVHS